MTFAGHVTVQYKYLKSSTTGKDWKGDNVEERRRGVFFRWLKSKIKTAKRTAEGCV